MIDDCTRSMTLREVAEADRRSLLARLKGREIQDTIVGSDSGLRLVMQPRRPGRPVRRARADARRNGHRQGGCRARDPQSLAALGLSFHPSQLRRDSPRADRFATFRPRTRQLHRRDGNAQGMVRAGRWRNAFSRRDLASSRSRREKSDCCVSCKMATSSASEANSRSVSMCEWWPPRIATCR